MKESSAWFAADVSVVLALAASVPTTAGAQQKPAVITDAELRWRLVWSDEFDTPGLPDPSKWSYEVGGHGWGNNELQFYTEARRENARVEDGRLIVEARREDWQGKSYTSARLNSRAGWLYGRIEVR